MAEKKEKKPKKEPKPKKQSIRPQLKIEAEELTAKLCEKHTPKEAKYIVSRAYENCRARIKK